MDLRTAERIESVVDAAAASLLAGAVGYAFYKLAIAQASVAGAGVAFGLSFAGLRRVQPVKDAPPIDRSVTTPVGDLLAEADRSLAHEEDELVLDDILAALNPDSRVVRLFERDAMPTPGQLQGRIERHLEGGASARSQDASQALHDALADLRRSLN
jgi:hypothetical protein